MKINSKSIVVVVAFILGLVVGVGLATAEMIWLPDGFKAAGEVQEDPNKTGPLIELGEFTVNLSGGGVLKTEITLEGLNESSSEIIQEKQTFLTDRTISVLSCQKIPTVAQLEGKEKIKSELLAQLNELCNNEIKEVLFTSYIYSW